MELGFWGKVRGWPDTTPLRYGEQPGALPTLVPSPRRVAPGRRERVLTVCGKFLRALCVLCGESDRDPRDLPHGLQARVPQATEERRQRPSLLCTDVITLNRY